MKRNFILRVLEIVMSAHNEEKFHSTCIRNSNECTQ